MLWANCKEDTLCRTGDIRPAASPSHLSWGGREDEEVWSAYDEDRFNRLGSPTEAQWGIIVDLKETRTAVSERLIEE